MSSTEIPHVAGTQYAYPGLLFRDDMPVEITTYLLRIPF